MQALFIVIIYALNLYIWIVIAMAIFSWLVAFNVVNTRNHGVAMIGEFLYRITEPALRPIRNLLPNLGGIDISPVILFLIILFIEKVIEIYILPNVFWDAAWALGADGVALDVRVTVRSVRGAIEGVEPFKGLAMTATIIDGKAIAAALRAEVSAETHRLGAAHGLHPGLAVVLVGDNPASKSYVTSKSRAVVEVGMRPFDYHWPADTSEAELLDLVHQLNADPSVNGILVQLPLPPQINPTRIIASIAPEKDVDGFHPINAGRLVTGLPALVPCTPIACLKLIKTVQSSLAGMDALMVGRSHIVGTPMAQMLLNENATVTVAHTRTRHLPDLCRRADILCVAIGSAEFVRGDWIKPGATVIDVGINRVTRDGKSKIVGDVNYAEAVEVAGAITPVPGGVGPMTIVCLLLNTLRAACMQAGLPAPAV